MKKILVVDDDADIIFLVQTILTSNGYEVLTHSTGINVPDLIKIHNPDLVLLDIRLPGKLGTEICRELKAMSNRPPIILFSAHAREEYVLAACKADAFISKPFELDDFLELVKLHAAA